MQGLRCSVHRKRFARVRCTRLSGLRASKGGPLTWNLDTAKQQRSQSLVCPENPMLAPCRQVSGESGKPCSVICTLCRALCWDVEVVDGAGAISDVSRGTSKPSTAHRRYRPKFDCSNGPHR